MICLSLPRFTPLVAGAALALLSAVLTPAEALDAPKPGAFPNDLLTGVLSRYVDATGKLDYHGILANRGALDSYVGYVGLVSPAKNPETFPSLGDKLAYYVNAYNALVITGVIDRPGIKSVNDARLGFFTGTKYTVGGESMNLYNLENQVIRPMFHDPRLHMALNCQSAGCPRLLQHALDPATMDAELDASAKEFCTSPARVFQDAAGTWHISQIFEWYADDFAATGGVVKFIDAHGGTIPVDAKPQIIPYDWALSAQAGKGP